MSHKYSITTNGTGNDRRKSVFTSSLNNNNLNEASSQTIELERLEQEITLTLQNIDKSFAKSHRIVNDKLIPIVKKYHSNSKKVWNGVNFWKTFLETSANVELRGYEEAIQQHQEELPSDSKNGINEHGDETLEKMSPVKVQSNHGGYTNNDILVESTNHTIQQFQKRYTNNLSDFNGFTPSGALGNQISSSLDVNPIMPQVDKNNVGFDTTDSILPPIPQSANLSNTNGTDVNQTTPTLQRTNTDSRHYLIHNNLDSHYKLEVTPKKKHTRTEGIVNSVTPKKPASKKRKSFYAEKYDSSPFDIETPKLQSDVQFSPVKPRRTPSRKSQEFNKLSKKDIEVDDNTTQRFPHTPRYGAGGTLLHTPGQVARAANRYSEQNFEADQTRDGSNIVDDSEEAPNISPPVTLNFATVQSTQRLSKTPAREAAQNIVKDILNNVSGINDSALSDDVSNKRGGEPYDSTNTQDSLFHEVHDKGITVDRNEKDLDDFDTYLDRPPESKEEGDDWSDN